MRIGTGRNGGVMIILKMKKGILLATAHIANE